MCVTNPLTLNQWGFAAAGIEKERQTSRHMEESLSIMLLILKSVQDSPRNLVKNANSDRTGLWWGPRLLPSDKFPEDIDASCLGTPFGRAKSLETVKN